MDIASPQEEIRKEQPVSPAQQSLPGFPLQGQAEPCKACKRRRSLDSGVEQSSQPLSKRLRIMTVQEAGLWISKELSSDSCCAGAEWIAALQKRMFEEEVDGMTLAQADHRMLKSLNVPTIGKRERVLRKIRVACKSSGRIGDPARPAMDCLTSGLQTLSAHVSPTGVYERDSPTSASALEPIVVVASLVLGFAFEQLVSLRSEAGLAFMSARAMHTIVVCLNSYAICALVACEVSMLQLETKTPDGYGSFLSRTKHHRIWGKFAGLYAMPPFLLACSIQMVGARQKPFARDIIPWDVWLVSAPCFLLAALLCQLTIMETRKAFREELKKQRGYNMIH